MQKTIFTFLSFLFLFSCSNKIYPDRSQFIKDGDFAPIVDLSRYKSVQERPAQNSDLALALAISGGGSRAANFGIGVMLGLERIKSPGDTSVLQEVDYLSTVSGGGFAGGAYINAIYQHQLDHKEGIFLLDDCVGDAVQPCLARPYTKDLVRAAFLPKLWFSLLDDGDVLEQSINNYVLGYKARKKKNPKAQPITLGDMFIPQENQDRPVRLPMMFTNATAYDKMVIFPFAPDVLEQYGINGFTHNLRKFNDVSPFAMPLSVGIKASGSFPVLISNTTLSSSYHKKRKYLHVLDGAMSDNFGYYTAMEVLKQDTARRRALFVVDADNLGNNYTFSKKESAHFSVGVFGRLASSGLDARRILMEKDLTEVSECFGLKPVFFSFNRLIQNNEAQPPEVIKNVKLEQQRLVMLMKKDIENISDFDLQILYDLVTHIDTKYTITTEEQELLLLTGQKVVLMQREEILEAIR